MSQSELAQVTDSDRHRRDNFWGDDPDAETDGGHAEVETVDPAEYIAFQELLAFVQPICERTIDADPWNGGRTAEQFAWLLDGECIDGRGDELHTENRYVELSAPKLHLPKQIERNGRYIEYRQHRHRRRYNPETGYINWGESTSTGLPEVGWETYWQAVHNYLASREIQITNTEEYLQRAKRFWHDQNLNSHQSMTKFVAFVRDEESGNGGDN